MLVDEDDEDDTDDIVDADGEIKGILFAADRDDTDNIDIEFETP